MTEREPTDDEPAATREVVVTAPKHPMQRSVTLANLAEHKDVVEDAEAADVSSEFSVLRLDLKMGPAGGPAALVSQLEKASIANLVDERVQRTQDRPSRYPQYWSDYSAMSQMDTTYGMPVMGDMVAAPPSAQQPDQPMYVQDQYSLYSESPD